MKQQIRIIGGLYRGRKIRVAEVEGLRPTPVRVRETLFNWLSPYIKNAHCLDAFSGTGALGFEALSRGARKVTCLETNPKAYLNLKKQINLLSAKNVTAFQKDALEVLHHPLEAYDIIFLDPPFHTNLLSTAIATLEQKNTLKIDGILYTESNHPLNHDTKIWHCLKSKRTGNVHYALYQKRI